MKKFERELAALRKRVIDMGEVAERMIRQALAALIERDTAMIKTVLAEEEEMDRLQVEIDDEAIRLIAVYTPVARDLRFLLMVTRINAELERMGDQAVNMCEYVELLIAEPELKPLIDLPKMAELACTMVKNALQAFDEGDTEKAQATVELDDQVDTLDDQIFRELLTYMMSSPDTIARSMALILTSRSLERIADLATNICEEVVYLEKGEDIRHQ